MWSPEQLFKHTAAGKIPASLLILGEEAYLLREWKRLLLKQRIEITECDLKKKAPESQTEDFGGGLSLFGTRTLLWLKAPAPPAQWRAEGKRSWENIKRAADGQTHSVVVQAALDKRIKWDALGFEAQVRFELEPAKKRPWLERMNAMRESKLKREQLEFLAMLSDELLILDNWVELWSLGGDAWAAKSLGYTPDYLRSPARPASTAFAWVDAVIAGDRNNALRYLHVLLREELSEPLQLLALLTKSVRILCSLELGFDVSGQAPFLVDRLRGRKGRGLLLLRLCTQADAELKGSAVDRFGSLARLSA